MSDIFGRSTSRPTSIIKPAQIRKMVNKYIASGLNLVNVDPGEIVVFEDRQGKLKTSNVSFDDLLTKQYTADDDSIVVFKKGKLEPNYKITTITDKFDTIKDNSTMVKASIDSLTQLRTEYYSHVNNFATLRRNFNIADNVIEKFFGKKNIKPDEVTTTLADINTVHQKSTDDITAINSRLGVIRDTKSISDLIAINKKSIDDIKTITDAVKEDFPKIAPKLDKVKIPHDVKDIKNLMYVIKQGLNKEYSSGSGIEWYEITPGIYRITVFSEHQFNIRVFVGDNNKTLAVCRGVNTTFIAIENMPAEKLNMIGAPDTPAVRFGFTVTGVDASVVRVKLTKTQNGKRYMFAWVYVRVLSYFQ